MKIHEKLEKYFYKVKKLSDSWNYSLEEVLPDDEFLFAKCLEKRPLNNLANKVLFNSILKEFRKELGEDISKNLKKHIFLQTSMIFFLCVLNNFRWSKML